MTDQTERLGSLPGGRGVGAIALVEDDERRGESRIAQVRIEAGQLIRGAHRLVSHGPEGHRGQVPAQSADRDRALGTLAGTVTSRLGLSEGRSRAEDGLLDPRRAGSRRLAKRIRLNRDAAPTDDGQLLGVTCLFQKPPSAAPLRIPSVTNNVREENRGDANRRQGLHRESGQFHPVAVKRLR